MRSIRGGEEVREWRWEVRVRVRVSGEVVVGLRERRMEAMRDGSWDDGFGPACGPERARMFCMIFDF